MPALRTRITASCCTRTRLAGNNSSRSLSHRQEGRGREYLPGRASAWRSAFSTVPRPLSTPVSELTLPTDGQRQKHRHSCAVHWAGGMAALHALVRPSALEAEDHLLFAAVDDGGDGLMMLSAAGCSTARRQEVTACSCHRADTAQLDRALGTAAGDHCEEMGDAERPIGSTLRSRSSSIGPKIDGRRSRLNWTNWTKHSSWPKERAHRADPAGKT